MQNQQMQMAMNANGGPVNGTPIMANMSMPVPPPQRPVMDPREQLNTYIYDYFLRNNHNRLARAMVECDMKMSTSPPQKPSPSSKPNGIDAMDDDSSSGLPLPLLPKNQMADNSFLLDWWVQFWDIYQATKDRSGTPSKGAQYITHTRVSILDDSTASRPRPPANPPPPGPHPDAERAAQPAHDDEQPHERPVPERRHDARQHPQRRRPERPQARRSPEQPPVRLPRLPACPAPR